MEPDPIGKDKWTDPEHMYYIEGLGRQRGKFFAQSYRGISANR